MKASQKKPSNVESSTTRFQYVTFGLEKVAREVAIRLEASPSTIPGSVQVGPSPSSDSKTSVWRVSWKANV